MSSGGNKFYMHKANASKTMFPTGLEPVTLAL